MTEVSIRKEYVHEYKKLSSAGFFLFILFILAIHINLFEEFNWVSFVISIGVVSLVYYFGYSHYLSKILFCKLRKQASLITYQGINHRFSFTYSDIQNYSYSTNSVGNMSHVKLHTKLGTINLDRFFPPSSAIAAFENFSGMEERPQNHEFYFHLFLHNFLWILNGFFALFILDSLFWANSINFLVYVFFAFGVLFLVHRPINILTRLTSTIDVAVGLLGIFIFFFYFTIVVVVPRANFDDDLLVPCARLSPQMQCYKVSETLCHSVWDNIDQTCHFEMAEVLARKGPTALTGPILKKCRNEKFDKFLHYNRRNSDSEICSEYFSKIK